MKKRKGFSLVMPNGYKLCFYTPFDIRKKSYDILINNGIDNVYTKVGNLQDIETMEKVFDWIGVEE